MPDAVSRSEQSRVTFPSSVSLLHPGVIRTPVPISSSISSNRPTMGLYHPGERTARCSFSIYFPGPGTCHSPSVANQERGEIQHLSAFLSKSCKHSISKQLRFTGPATPAKESRSLQTEPKPKDLAFHGTVIKRGANEMLCSRSLIPNQDWHWHFPSSKRNPGCSLCIAHPILVDMDIPEFDEE